MSNDVSETNVTSSSDIIPLVGDECIKIDDDVDCIEIDDDDEVIIKDNNPNKKVDTIGKSTKQNEVIDLEDECHTTFSLEKETSDSDFSAVADLMTYCISIDDSFQMQRILKKNFLPLYKECKLKGVKMKKVLHHVKNTKKLLVSSPEYRYSHFIRLCSKLKKIKKKFLVNPKATGEVIQNEIKNKTKEQRKRIQPITLSPAKKQKTDTPIIVPDTDEVTVVSDDEPIEIESDVEDNCCTDGVVVTNSTTENMELQGMALHSVNKSLDRPETISNVNTIQQIISNAQDTGVQHYSVNLKGLYNSSPVYMSNEAKIKSIEEEIKYYKSCIKKLEVLEVSSDDYFSPYVQCDLFKAKIVKKYKELCGLKNMECMKRHQVRLQAAPRHAEGPVKCLEEFLNSNIDEHGNPPFPDINDVLQCVMKANQQYKLNWTPKDMNAEARFLLKQLGEFLQSWRKRREWSDLISICKGELVDPADSDPVLEAKLRANRAISKMKEDELFDKYAKMQEELSRPPGASNGQLEHSAGIDNAAANMQYTILAKTVNPLNTFLENNINQNQCVTLQTVDVSFEQYEQNEDTLSNATPNSPSEVIDAVDEISDVENSCDTSVDKQSDTTKHCDGATNNNHGNVVSSVSLKDLTNFSTPNITETLRQQIIREYFGEQQEVTYAQDSAKNQQNVEEADVSKVIKTETNHEVTTDSDTKVKKAFTSSIGGNFIEKQDVMQVNIPDKDPTDTPLSHTKLILFETATTESIYTERKQALMSVFKVNENDELNTENGFTETVDAPLEKISPQRVCAIRAPEKQVVKVNFNGLDVVIENSITMTPTLVLDGTHFSDDENCENVDDSIACNTVSENSDSCIDLNDSENTCDMTDIKDIKNESELGDNFTNENSVNLDHSLDSDHLCENTNDSIDIKHFKTENESEDIPTLLNELGDNYTTSVFIEDPFLIIDISDSSSDSETE